MKIEDILKTDCILCNVDASDKETALKIMAEKLYSLGYVKESYIQAIQDREANYPSGLPMEDLKIAIPHTDADHVNQSIICFARLPENVEFSVMGAPEEKIPVRLISMFALKEKKKIGDLLETLITTYQDNEVLKALLDAENETQIYNILHENVGKNLKAS
ncbi:MAG: PTS sugar transporter subunit IIA [Spirochaetales bacterium]|uniref:PTS sugar transporter subunit IIA n=1 Tax=Candidatus Thalassospirochaeta sargassi TaxID=3119039 RepID=A0AAJ1IFW6_9SPIO|nr:PTS sugar transporter subunit IIA [Spirochaetales bacterium]